MNNNPYSKKDNSRLIIGLVFVLIGVIYLFRPFIPYELRIAVFNWKTFLIIIGIVIAAVKKGKGSAWWILIVIGCYFYFIDLARYLDFYKVIAKVQIPIIMIVIGAFIIFRTRNNRKLRNHQRYGIDADQNDIANTYNNTSSPILPNDLFEEAQVTEEGFHTKSDFTHQNTTNSINPYDEDENSFNINAIFGTNRKILRSKQYRGSNVNCIFGNIYLDAVETEFDGVIYIDILNIFGSVDLILPSNYEVKNDLLPVMGSVNDRRTHLRNPNTENKKYIVLKGTILFGNIDIKS